MSTEEWHPESSPSKAPPLPAESPEAPAQVPRVGIEEFLNLDLRNEGFIVCVRTGHKSL